MSMIVNKSIFKNNASQVDVICQEVSPVDSIVEVCSMCCVRTVYVCMSIGVHTHVCACVCIA